MPIYGPWFGWEIFPVIGLIFMGVMLFFMFGPDGFLVSRGSGWGRWGELDRQAGRRSESPLGILQRRYAAGEITKEEYEEICRDRYG